MLPAGTISIGSPINLASNLTIVGSSIGTTILDGKSTTNILITRGTGATLLVRNLTIQHGATSAATGGGGIYLSADSFTLSQVNMNMNQVTGPTGGSFGGAISVHHGNLTVAQSVFTNNTAPNNNGGAISNYADNGINNVVKITGTTFRNNMNTGVGLGGAVFMLSNSSVTSIIDSCLFQNNTSDGAGAALNLRFGKTLVTNSTFIGNSSPSGAGAIAEFGTNIIQDVVNCTFVGNQSRNAASAGALAGSIRTANSIFSGNTVQGSPKTCSAPSHADII